MIYILIFSLLFSSFTMLKIAIVGCGVGGSYLANQLLNHHVTIFEKNGKCGGRATHFHIKEIEEHQELGAHFFIKDNKYFMDTVKQYNLTHVNKEDGTMGIMRNKELILETSSYDIVTFLKVVYHYGLSPKQAADRSKILLDNFQNIYKFQEGGKYFKTYQEFIEIIGLSGIDQDFKTFLNNEGFGQAFIDEFIHAIILSIYNQKYYEMNSVAGIVSLIAVFNEAYSIEGGNTRIVQELSKNLNVEQLQVRSIKKNGQKYLINDMKQEFDIVVIAHLLDGSIEFDGDKFKKVIKDSQHQETHIYYVAGDIKLDKFGLNDDNLKTYIFLDQQITGLTKLCDKCYQNQQQQQKSIYRLVSRIKLGIADLFYNMELIHYQFWNPAYPKLVPNQQFDILLDDNLYYLNSMEYLASCMEMEMISAKNIANMINEGHTTGIHNDL